MESLRLEVLEHLGVRVLPPLSLVRFVNRPLHEGRDTSHLLLKQCQLGLDDDLGSLCSLCGFSLLFHVNQILLEVV